MSELSTISRHAVTVLAGQLAVMAFGVADTIVAGRYSEASLAALSVGSAIFISVYVALIGVLQALMPVWAELRGAGQQAQMGASLRQSLYLCAVASALGMAVLLSPGALLRWTEVPDTLRGEVENYLAVLALALPPALLFRIYSTLNQALGRPQLVTWLQVGSLFIKVPLSIWFTFGGAGLPAQGAVGCAWATLVVNCSMLALALWLLRTQSLYRPLALWQPLERPHWPTIAGFARLGVPAGLAVMVEVTSFTLMALFIARQGTVASAAHQIASNLAAVLYMVPLSLSIATSARVSYWLGAGEPLRARQVGLLGLRLACTMGLALAALMFLGRNHLGVLYSSNTQVVAVTGGLLAWVAAYHVADALQTLCVFVLRCYRITVAPLVVYCTLLWGAGLGGGYLLAYQGLGPWAAMATPATFWAASAVALAVTAALFAAMLWRAIRLPVPAALARAAG
ncbi:MATE family multidrug resistance protein [Acidovorax soli]|jgi:MATE family multidrug resistance protein|uniref:MATE family multidrug resistance protein n=1 Tax=Acidovorax soli TaxID=592050 RepID=A0A7X0PJ68_9BURK|nr:MATE family efflux transporter [Acidovorax soli]MBB6562401.1 MATE family multidrug resistance protein [Acidovorax soli]